MKIFEAKVIFLLYIVTPCMPYIVVLFMERTYANLQLPDPTCTVYWLHLRLTVSVHPVAAYMSEYNCPPKWNNNRCYCVCVCVCVCVCPRMRACKLHTDHY